MKRIKITMIAALTGATLWLGSAATADLVITEVMSSSSQTFLDGDWWELTNTGTNDVDLSGYYWDDNGPDGDDGALFNLGIVIQSGESLVIVNHDGTELPMFVEAWGGGFRALSTADFRGPDTFSGLSGNGDQIQLWDEDPNANPAANLVAEVLFGSSTEGSSFEYLHSGASLGLSIDGEFGAYVAPGDGGGGIGTDVGSPGFSAVPEPTAVLIFSGVAMTLIVRRRRV